MTRAPRSFMHGSTPTVLLLHGAFADASAWAAVISELLAAGTDVCAPALPLRGLATDAAYIASVAAQFDGPVLLVGHGYGGAVASVAASHAGNVVGLVYIAGLVLEPGESAVAGERRFLETLAAAALRPVECRTPDGAAAIDLYVRSDAFHDIFAADLPATAAAVMAVTQRPIAAAALDERAQSAAWRTRPSWYLVATADRAIDPEVQRFMARRAGAETVEVPASHAVALSQPAAVARLIRTAAACAEARPTGQVVSMRPPSAGAVAGEPPTRRR
jgi:pimeloyl-ACP methyl ester carboxylesterase